MIKLTSFAYSALTADHVDLKRSQYPVTSKRIPIVLLHGWGFNGEIWQSSLPFLRSISDVIVIDLSYGEENADNVKEGSEKESIILEQVVNQLKAQLPPKVILCGWSLGGMIATRMAADCTESVCGLITLASNLRFVANGSWPTGMPRNVFDEFLRSITNDTKKTLKRFSALVSQGDKAVREQRRYLNSIALSDAQSSQLPQGLKLLASIDNQACFQKISQPALHIFADNDALVPSAAVNHIKALNPQHEYMVLEHSGHLLHMPEDKIHSILANFFQRAV